MSRIFSAVILLPFLLCACSEKNKAPENRERSLMEQLASGRVQVTMTATPAIVALDRPMFLKLTFASPESLSVNLPDLSDRLEGFEISGIFESGSAIKNGKKQSELTARLMPVPSHEYRIKPMAVSFFETNSPANLFWTRTKPYVFESMSLPSGNEISNPEPPIPIHISAKEAAYIALGLICFLIVMYFLVRLAMRIQRNIKLRQMSPRQRALLELDELAAKKLSEQGKIKEFYFELTLVVRRYIERRHGIRAPEQTTEEFLASAGGDARFPKESLEKLREFLSSADLVKYANFKPGPETGPIAMETARNYVTSEPEEPKESN